MNLSLGKQKNGHQINMVTFQLDHLTFALPIEPIRQIIEMVTITPVPQMDESLEGVINYHGLTVPVINLRRHVGMPESPAGLHTPLIIANIAGRLVGLMVDQVQDVISRSLDQITRPRDILPSGLEQTGLFKGIIQLPDQAILLLDLDHLFDPHQTRTLTAAASALKTQPSQPRLRAAKPAPEPAPAKADAPKPVKAAAPKPAPAPVVEKTPEPEPVAVAAIQPEPMPVETVASAGASVPEPEPAPKAESAPAAAQPVKKSKKSTKKGGKK